MAKNSLRKLSDNELSYLRFGDLASPFFTVFLELKLKKHPRLVIDAIDKAFRKTMNSYNELNIIASGRQFVYRKSIAEVTIVNGNFDGYNLNNLSKVFSKTELVQLYYINNHYLAFRFNHAYIDGSGALMLIDFFLECILGKSVKNKTNSYISDLDYIREIDHVKRGRNLSFKNKLLIKPIRGRNNVYYKRLTLSKKVPLLLGRIIVIMNNYFKNDNLTYLLPTNIRKARPEITSIGNLTEILYLECNKSDDWLAISRKIHKGISKGDNLNIKNVDYGLVMDLPSSVYRGLVKLSAIISHHTGRFLTAGSITSLTHYFDKYDNPIFTIDSAFMLPFYQPLLPYVLNIMEAKNKTEIIFCSNDSYISQNLADNVLNDIKRQTDDECLHSVHK